MSNDSVKSTNKANGILFGLLGATLFASMGIILFYAHEKDPSYSPSFSSFLRVLMNSLILFLPLRFWGIHNAKKHPIQSDGKPLLWIWGLLGAATLSSYYVGIAKIGMSEASFLQSSQGIFIAFFAPLITKQKSTLLSWIAVLGSALGIIILYNPTVIITQSNSLGRLAALGSGFFAALAYCILALLPGENSRTISFYWCLFSFITHIFLWFFIPMQYPNSSLIIFLILLAGLLASLGQVSITLAYQRTPAIQLAALNYLTPVLSLLLEFLFLKKIPSINTLLGSTIVVFFGAILPIICANFSSEGIAKAQPDNL